MQFSCKCQTVLLSIDEKVNWLTTLSIWEERCILWIKWDTSSVMYPAFIVCLGITNITHPCPGDPPRNWSSHDLHPRSIRPLLPPFQLSLLPQLQFWWLSPWVVPSCQTRCRLCRQGSCRSPCSLPPLDGSVLATSVSGNHPEAPGTWPAFFQKPCLSSLHTAQSVLSWQAVSRPLTE